MAGLSLEVLITIGVLVVVLLGVGLTVGLRSRRVPKLPTDSPLATQLDEVTSAPPVGAVPDAGVVSGADAPVATPTLERPEAAGTRMQRLRARLARSGGLGQAILSVLSRGDLSESDWEEIEDTLLLADVGMGPTTELMENLRREAKVIGTADGAEIRALLRAQLLTLVDPTMGRELYLDPVVADDGTAHPATVLVVGVNGTGKTTTVAKIARLLVAVEKSVVLGAADTFRAAAADQLQTWGDRVGVPVVRSDVEGADPAAVAYDAVRTGRDTHADVVLVDTAGRLQNKAGLMDELGKIKRVMGREAPVREVLLVLDATTGQNGLTQAKVFAEAVDVTGIVLTKLDGTAKGGIVVAVQRELGVPVKFIGLGEGPDDLAPFDPAGFVDALLS